MIRIDEFPTHELNGIKYRCGRVQPFGASIVGNTGINFSIFSQDATYCELVLFHHGQKKPFARIPFPDEFRIGNVFSMIVYDLDIDDIEYGYCMDGPFDPVNGYRFDREKILLDPYAKLVSGRNVWGVEPDWENPFQHRGCVIMEDYDWEGDKPLEIPMKDLVIYETHVRSFTKDESSGVKHKGTFAGLVEKIPYLKELGINCIELLPIFEFDEFENSRVVDGERLYNYWGYSTVCFYAPKAGYAASAPLGLAADELKNLIKQMHKAGIEVMLDVVFNHTAEGNEQGPYISYRGIDNKTYYLLTPDGYYYNFSGCGNTMNCNNAVVRNCILDALRYWVSDYHIDGFRFDLAAILSRDEYGAPMTSPPLLETLAHDAVLGKTKLIAEAWDAGGLYQVGSFPSWGRWAEWNGKYRDCVRKFIKSGAESGPELIYRLKGSPDLYGNRCAEASINFITCHDGFTLNDLVSYNEKHNMANGENNNDGSNDNDSWNCGVEGETKDKEILALRRRQIKNAAALLLLSRGIPMLLSGDEFANTQYGNNNAYCQDNSISHLDWNRLKENKDIFTFFKTLIEFRAAHPVLRRSDFYKETKTAGYPELSFHSTKPWEFDADKPFLSFGFMYSESAEEYGTKEDCFIYCAVNAFWESAKFELPKIPDGMEWETVAYSGYDKTKYNKDSTDNNVELMPRSIMLLLGHKKRTDRKGGKKDV